MTSIILSCAVSSVGLNESRFTSPSSNNTSSSLTHISDFTLSDSSAHAWCSIPAIKTNKTNQNIKYNK